MNTTQNFQLKKDTVILPSDAKVCATCSYWDGQRKVDEELQLVVVKTSEKGQCLVKEQHRFALSPKHLEHNCLWEDLNVYDNQNNDENNQTTKQNNSICLCGKCKK